MLDSIGLSIAIPAWEGLNTVKQGYGLKPSELLSCSNVAVCDNGFLKTRDYGMNPTAITDDPVLFSATLQSGLYLYTDALYRVVNGAMVPTGCTSLPLCICDSFDFNWFIAGTRLGWFGMVPPAITGDEFLADLPVGYCAETYNGKVFSGRGVYLYYSNIGSISMDVRTNFLPLDSPAVMIGRVDDGLVVSEQQGIYFVRELEDGHYMRTKIASSSATTRPVKIKTHYVSKDWVQNFGSVALVFDTTDGRCVAGKGGMFVNMTIDRYNWTTNTADIGTVILPNHTIIIGG